MNREEAKEILLPYRHGTTDAEDPQIAEALALAKHDPELGRWLEAHCVRQDVLREKFRQISAPEGLMQQIISEHAAANRARPLDKKRTLTAVFAVAIILIAVFSMWNPSQLWHRPPPPDTRLITYQNQMTSVALSGYGMDLATNSTARIREYLKQNNAPADFALTEPLKQVALTGCAVEGWQEKSVSLVCFHTGSTSTNTSVSDLWLFVADRSSFKDAPEGTAPRFLRIDRFITATWTEGDKVYMLGRQGDVEDLKKYL